MIKLKLLYYCLNVMICALHSYKAKFLNKDLGLSLSQIGYVYTLQATSFFGSILWTTVADGGKSRAKYLSMLAALLYAGTTCLVLVDGRFWWVMLVMGGSYLTSSGLFPLLDAEAMLQIEQNNSQADKKGEFGRQRMWGAFGVMSASWMALGVNKALGMIRGMFLILVVSSLLYSVLAYFYFTSNAELDKKDEQRAEGEYKLIQLLKSPLYVNLLLFVLTAGVVRSVINIYQPYYLDVSLALGPVGPPFSASIRLISELGMYFFGHYLVEVFGHHGALLIAQGAGIMRLFGYGYLPKGSSRGQLLLLVGMLELMKGVNGGLLVVGATKLAATLAPLGCERTAQGILTGVFIGLATCVGGLWSAIFMSSTPDIAILFRWTCLITLAAWLIFIIHYYSMGIIFRTRIE